MRRLLFFAATLLTLGGCMSVFDNAYDEQARTECEQERPSDRGGCLDRVDRNRRDRD